MIQRLGRFSPVLLPLLPGFFPRNPAHAQATAATVPPRLASETAVPDASTHTAALHTGPTPSPPRFAVFSGRTGAPATLDALAQALDTCDVVLLGEYHDDPVAHQVELELLRRVVERGAQRRAALSLEMFESDVQLVLDEYLSGDLRERDLLKDARPWPNYVQDYKPLVELCKERGVPVIAANAPRRYVSIVGRDGPQALERLSPDARRWLPPLPYATASPSYVAKVTALMNMARQPAPAAPPSAPASAPAAGSSAPPPSKGPEERPTASTAAGEAGTAKRPSSADIEEGDKEKEKDRECPHVGFTPSSNFLAAQSTWDATMAWRIASFLSAATPGPSSPRPLVLHVCGKAHCESGLGIPEHLKAYAPGAKVLIITMEPIDGFSTAPERIASLSDTVMAASRAAPGGWIADFVVVSDGAVREEAERAKFEVMKGAAGTGRGGQVP